VKSGADILRHYEGLGGPALLGPTVKYDNRALAVRSIEFWLSALRSGEKVSVDISEVPNNEASELLVQGYAAALQR
jgi:hypothetical protein